MRLPKSIVIVTGGFDPIHSGHISYIKAAKQLGELLFVGANSDSWLTQKKGRPFMPIHERLAILSALEGVDEVWEFDDSDNSSRDLIRKVRQQYPGTRIIFANGGDRVEGNVPEQDMQESDSLLEFAFGVGGENKMNSSRWILEKWQYDRTDRDWGHFDILKDYPGCKLKEIVVEPNHCLSYQQHDHREELWLVREGSGTVIIDEQAQLIYTGDYVHVPRGSWHQLINGGKSQLKIIEIQYGTKCDETDIRRMK
jgi:cytidyltransferase-like protein